MTQAPLSPQMVAVGRKIPVLKLSRLKRGYYFKSCRRYVTADGVAYDCELFNARHQKLKLQVRGPRKMLSFSFPLKRDRHEQERLDVHRVLAVNFVLTPAPRPRSPPAEFFLL